ncbi:MAG: family 43 glycosylhydrolase [Planctomycetaceae bacterium]|nr:family 43 glycosylhydrolase [Planctomycetaceae bacterium]
MLVFLGPLLCFAETTFQNPGKYAADPMILRKPTGEAVTVDGRFFLYFTGGGPNHHSFVARSTADFVEWKEEGVVFDGKDTWARSAYWAPEVYEIEGKFYLFFSAQNSDLPWTQEELFNIGVAVADHPAGPFQLLMDRPIFEPDYPIIDANLFIDSDGTPYLTYSRCCYQHPVESELAGVYKRHGWYATIEESWIYGVQLTPDFTGIVGEPVLLLRPPLTLGDAQAEWESRSVVTREVNRRWTEGSTLLKHNGTYYLMYSANNFAGDHYAVGYATSDKPLGPYEKAENNPVLEKNTPSGGEVRGTGHNNIFYWPDRETMYCVYHGRTQGDVRRLFIDRMEIDAQGILRVHGPTTTPQSGIYATVAEWETAREAIKSDWLRFLGKYAEFRTADQPARPVPYEVLGEELVDGVKRLKIRYTTEPGQSVEAFLLMPAKLDQGEKRPAAVVFHSTSVNSHKQPAGISDEPTKAFGLCLAQRGFITICPQNFLWPEVGNFDRNKADEYLKRNPGSRGMTRMLLDGQVAVDLLCGLENVDPGRIACIGHSLGAKEVLYLAAFDERIAYTISSEGGIGIKQCNWNAPWYLGAEAFEPDFPRNHAQLLALVAPRSFLLIGGGASDNAESNLTVEAARRIYRLYDSSDKLEFFLHDKGHTVAPEAEEAIYRGMDEFARGTIRP